MAQYYASCIKIMAQSCAPWWLNAVYPWLTDGNQASIVSITSQRCASGTNVPVHHASICFDAVHPQLNDLHHAGISMVCIRHTCCWYGSHRASLWHIIWFIAVQASIYGMMFCIKDHNIYGSNLCISVSIWLDAVHRWVKLCIMHQYGSIQHNSSH